MNLFIFILTLSFVSNIHCQQECHTRKTCGACIGCALERCVWCSENMTDIGFRCQPKSYYESHPDWCKQTSISMPSSYNETKQDNSFTSNVQFRPQEMYFKASPGVEVKFEVSYKPALDFPVDVYFLMDYSYTMKKHTEALQNQAMAIFDGLRNITRNVRLGVGSFVEKPGLPYADVVMISTKTLPAYAFKNHLSLTDNMTEFQIKVAGSEFGSNYDDAEAGLDALMQVMKCDKLLGWREKTRRIIVLATDNTYHSAGDGKMLGAIKPNDMKCHLIANEYTRKYALTYDYPSVSLINKVATDGNFLIIFAATPNVQEVYEALSKQIPVSKYAKLQKESNILDIIKTAYKESVDKIELGHSPTEHFEIIIDQQCDDQKPIKNCISTPDNETVTIPITIKSKNCNIKSERITINPLAFNEKLTIKFDVDCECGCEKNSTTAARNTSRSDCNNKGYKECGTCLCDKDWGGDSCEVSCSDESSIVLEKKCLSPGSSIKCNGHGTCKCGKCTCSDGFTGDTCEYDPNSCDTGPYGKICSGKDHGTCRFGKCSCINNWSGNACDCPPKEKWQKHCTGPFSKKMCSGKGTCDCGKCICHKIPNGNGEIYPGTFCDFCGEDCALERCKELEGYAICIHKQNKDVCDSQFEITEAIKVEVLVANKSELATRHEWTTGTQCRPQLEDGTFLLFKYNADTNNNSAHAKTDKLLLMIQRETETPPKAAILIPIASAIAGILLIGILTIVFWKVLIEWYDKREYNKFCDEAKSQGYDVSQNPLYEPPTQNFVNPGFNQNI